MTTIAQAIKQLEQDIETKQNQLAVLMTVRTDAPEVQAKKYGPVKKPRKPSKPSKPRRAYKFKNKSTYRKGASAKMLSEEFTGRTVRGAMKEVMNFTNFSDKTFSMDDIAGLIVNPKIRKPAAIRGCISVGLSEMPDVVTRVGRGQYQLKHAFNVSPR